MTSDEQRLQLVTGGCPECGHAVLNHRKGTCQTPIIALKGIPVECGCRAIQPSNSQGTQQVLITSTPVGTGHEWIKKRFL